MERKIIFRGKRYNGCWVYGDLCMPANRFVSIRENKYNYNGVSHEEYEVIEETIGQFTGLYDKHSKEVYEHDYVSINYKHDRHTLNGMIPDQDCFCEGEIVFMKSFACFGIRLYKAEYPMIEELNSNPYITFPLINFSLECEDIEVLGNIHDNENLLNKE